MRDITAFVALLSRRLPAGLGPEHSFALNSCISPSTPWCTDMPHTGMRHPMSNAHHEQMLVFLVVWCRDGPEVSLKRNIPPSASLGYTCRVQTAAPKRFRTLLSLCQRSPCVSVLLICILNVEILLRWHGEGGGWRMASPCPTA